MKSGDLEKAARLARSLEYWAEWEKALKKNAARGAGMSIDVGYIEDEGRDELVQPDYGIVVDPPPHG